MNDQDMRRQEYDRFRSMISAGVTGGLSPRYVAMLNEFKKNKATAQASDETPDQNKQRRSVAPPTFEV